MKTTRFGRVDVVLPDLDDDLSPVEHLGGRGPLADFEYLGTSVRQIDVEDRRLARGWIRDLEAQRAEFADVTLESVLFERCSLLSAQWTRCNLSRVVFRDCRLVGATFDEHKWANVIFRAASSNTSPWTLSAPSAPSHSWRRSCGT